MIVGGPACVNTEAVTDPALPRPMSEDYQAPSGAGHPIPPPELVEQWARYQGYETPEVLWRYIATQAARWGFKQCIELDASWLEAKLQKARDEELEACCEWMVNHFHGMKDWAAKLRAARRPKPPSLAVKALAEIQEIEGAMYSADLGCDFTATRRALERLQELENNG